MAETNWRELCRELVQHAADAEAVLVGEGLWDGDEDDGLLERATAAIEADELAVIERGIAADRARRPAPAAEGEVAWLVDALRNEASAAEQGHLWMTPSELRRAADLLERQAAPVPAAVSERLPGPEDCDAKGKCWFFDPCYDGWWWLRPALIIDSDPEPLTHWLPANALPLPGGEVSDG